MFEFIIIFLPAFLLGILHTIVPCEDKAIFFFWSFGISKTPRRSLNILVLYGFGLISSNMIIAMGTILLSFIPRLIAPGLIFNPFAVNFLGAVVSMFAGIFLLFFVTTRNYMPHSKQSKDIGTLDWEKNQTPYLFGILAGFAPCIFELIIYTQCLQFSLGYGFIEGLLIVFYFSLGTFIGLFPLALAKYGTSQIVKSRENRKNTIFILMILIIVVFNLAVMILSFLEISVFPLQNI